jgi:hypothetical protein
MARKVSIAVTQFACSSSHQANEDKAEALVREAAAAGANVILLQELFQGALLSVGKGSLRRSASSEQEESSHGEPRMDVHGQHLGAAWSFLESILLTHAHTHTHTHKHT